jgi:hypothetical protein
MIDPSKRTLKPCTTSTALTPSHTHAGLSPEKRIVNCIQTCPYLPSLTGGETFDHHLLGRHGEARDAAFYFDALRYGQALWHQGHAGRALLALTRALYADVAAEDPILQSWPLPYAAMAWMIRFHHSDDFPGNPRLSYQHQATRLCGERWELRSARAWAVWAIVRAIRPQLPGDPTCPEFSHQDIHFLLEKNGHPGESELWRQALGGSES